ncbi:MAG: hypothetical protein WBR26_21225 [Candidatus Acidiferrum sp.]
MWRPPDGNMTVSASTILPLCMFTDFVANLKLARDLVGLFWETVPKVNLLTTRSVTVKMFRDCSASIVFHGWHIETTSRYLAKDESKARIGTRTAFKDLD